MTEGTSKKCLGTLSLGDWHRVIFDVKDQTDKIVNCTWPLLDARNANTCNSSAATLRDSPYQPDQLQAEWSHLTFNTLCLN